MSEETVRPAFEGRERPLLSYGIAFPAATARHLDGTFQASRVYVICSGSLSRNTNVMDQLETALGPDRLVGHWIGMRSHTLWSEVLQIAEEVQTVHADLLLTVGAGSLTDGAKIIALVGIPFSLILPFVIMFCLYSFRISLFFPGRPYIFIYSQSNIPQVLANRVSTPEELETLAEGPKKRKYIEAPTLPIISVPTSLSAGEYSNFAGGTEDNSKRKYSFQPPIRGPELVILDPWLAKTTPDSIWLSTGVRAMDHCIESLCAIAGTTTKSDKLALNALGLLVPGLLRCKKDRSDRDAHLQCQLGSVDAMAACTSGSIELGASHGIGHQVWDCFPLLTF
jgi:alcohol dehydrogenase class IV